MKFIKIFYILCNYIIEGDKVKNKPVIRNSKSNYVDGVELSQIDEKNVDIYTPRGMEYPIMERLNNGLTWPEGGPKGGIDILETYEISSVPKDPGTPLDSVEVLMKKGVMPK